MEVDAQLYKNEVLGNAPSMDSRLLTKTQLTDLAVGVRELSKRFGAYFTPSLRLPTDKRDVYSEYEVEIASEEVHPSYKT